MFRSFDPQGYTAEFWGESFDVQALIKEVQRVLPKLKEETTKPRA